MLLLIRCALPACPPAAVLCKITALESNILAWSVLHDNMLLLLQGPRLPTISMISQQTPGASGQMVSALICCLWLAGIAVHHELL